MKEVKLVGHEKTIGHTHCLEEQLSTLKQTCTRNKKVVGAPGIATRSKKLLGVPGLTTRSKDASRGSWHCY